MNDNENRKSFSLGSLGIVHVSLLESEANEVFAKYPSTATSLCADGVTYRGTGGANLNDDAACPHVC